MEVLLSIYACGPNKGSEIGLGWNWVYNLSDHVQLHVLTESEFQQDIENALEKWDKKYKPIFYFIDIGSDKIRKMCWDQGDYRFYYYYKKWQKKAYIRAKGIIETNKISLIHHLNMIGYREPGYLWKLKDIPYVWGPIGGFGGIKLRYLPSIGFKNGTFYLIKNIVNYFQRFSPRVVKALRRSKLLLSASIESFHVIQKFYRRSSILFNETGAKQIVVKNSAKSRVENNELVVFWVGKFVARKALDIALRTMSHLRDKPIKLKIIGGGVNIDFYKDISDNLYLNNIEWLGEIQHESVLKELCKGDVLLFTSLDEGTPHVVLEALACGLPVLCHDICGQSTVITNDCGVKIKAISPDNSASEFAYHLSRLIDSNNYLSKLKTGALSRSKELLWSIKAKELVKLYKQIL